jgi:hypothetical protein
VGCSSIFLFLRCAVAIDGSETFDGLIIAVVAAEAMTKQDRFAFGRSRPLGQIVIALWEPPVCLFE